MPRNLSFLAILVAKQRAVRDSPAFETIEGSTVTYTQVIDEVGRAAAALRKAVRHARIA